MVSSLAPVNQEFLTASGLGLPDSKHFLLKLLTTENNGTRKEKFHCWTDEMRNGSNSYGEAGKAGNPKGNLKSSKQQSLWGQRWEAQGTQSSDTGFTSGQFFWGSDHWSRF